MNGNVTQRSERELLVKAYEKHPVAKDIAEAFSISVSGVYRLVRQKARTGSVALRVNQRGRKKLLSEDDIRNIKAQIKAHNDITIEEIREALNLKASYSTVERAVNGLGYTVKKKSLHASERDRARCTGKRTAWKEQLAGVDQSHLVYLDECGVNTDMTRIYGRSIGKTRVVDHAPLNTPQTTTILSSIRTDGSHVTVTYSGGTTGDRFTAYLRIILSRH